MISVPSAFVDCLSCSTTPYEPHLLAPSIVVVVVALHLRRGRHRVCYYIAMFILCVTTIFDDRKPPTRWLKLRAWTKIDLQTEKIAITNFEKMTRTTTTTTTTITTIRNLPRVWPPPQAIFASCIPEIIDLIGTRPKYGGTLKNERGRRWEPNNCIKQPHGDKIAKEHFYIPHLLALQNNHNITKSNQIYYPIIHFWTRDNKRKPNHIFSLSLESKETPSPFYLFNWEKSIFR